jgi:ATP-dependent RNA helicase DeaD
MSSDISFSTLGISDPILKSLEKMGFEKPTEIQQKSIPLLINGDQDFVGQAQTGTGKTAAFGIPSLMKVQKGKKFPQVLILAPTRELAIQISDELENFGRNLKVKRAILCGGMSYRNQLDNLRKNPEIIIGTPGRVIDMLERGALNLEDLGQLVLDEADEMLNMGFWDDVQKILEFTPKTRNLWMFSATLPKQIHALIKKEFKDPVFVKTESKSLSNDDINQYYHLVKDKYKLTALHRILDTIDDFYGIIFCCTKQDCKDLGLHLMDKNYNVSVLHGDLAQTERQSAMNHFKRGKTKVLICTDVASRGIDVNNVTHVINYGLPRDKESYVHRIGRTGRAGNKGTAISILDTRDVPRLRKIEQLLKTKIKQEKLIGIEELKRVYLSRKLQKIQLVKHNYTSFPEAFHVDELFDSFQEEFNDLDKEACLKILFSNMYRNDLRKMDEQNDLELNIDFKSMRSSGRDGGRGNSRGRNRSRNGNGRGRNERRASGSRDGGGRGSRSSRSEDSSSFKDMRRKRKRKSGPKSPFAN